MVVASLRRPSSYNSTTKHSLGGTKLTENGYHSNQIQPIEGFNNSRRNINKLIAFSLLIIANNMQSKNLS